MDRIRIIKQFLCKELQTVRKIFHLKETRFYLCGLYLQPQHHILLARDQLIKLILLLDLKRSEGVYRKRIGQCSAATQVRLVVCYCSLDPASSFTIDSLAITSVLQIKVIELVCKKKSPTVQLFSNSFNINTCNFSDIITFYFKYNIIN